MKKTHKQHWTF